MPDGADERHFAAVSCPGDDLGVEDPEVFSAAAAPGYDDFVCPAAFVQLSNGICDLLRRFKALHIDRAEQEFCRRPAPTNDIANVLQCRAGLAGDDADAFGIRGQRLFVLCRKKSLLLELDFQLLKSKLRRTNAVREHLVDIDLERSVPLIKSSTTSHDYLHALFRAEAQPPRIRAEHHRFDTGAGVPEREITVAAAGVLYEVCDLAPQRQIEQDVICIQQRLDILVQGRDSDHFSHSPASRAARIDTPMALSLEYWPGTKYTCGRRCCTQLRMMSLLMTPPAQTTASPGYSF